MATIATIVGARPQFIKAAVVSREIGNIRGLDEILIHTGQHYDETMSKVFFDEFEMAAPDFNLEIGSAGHGAQTGRMLEAIEAVFIECKPDLTLIYGDTNSTLAGALAAVKLHIPLAHVEAGLRSFNRNMPEEVNRVVADCVADLLFVPTTTAADNLLREGVDPTKIHAVGDVMYDAALQFGERSSSKQSVADVLGLKSREYVLATIHRAENTDHADRLNAIFGGLSDISAELPVVLPLHPRTRKVLVDSGLETQLPASLIRIEPVSYQAMVELEREARLIVTDSGGIQKEAYFHRTRCVTLRNETEWPELIALGCNHLLPPRDRQAVVSGIRHALAAVDDWSPDATLFGGGQASRRIVEVLEHRLLAP